MKIKIKKQLLYAVFITLTILTTYQHQAISKETKTSSKVLTFLNWSKYIDPELVREFEKENDVLIKEVYFETDETRDELIITTGAKGYDLMLVNGAKIEKYVKQNWITPIKELNIPNLTHIDKKWRNSFKDTNEYAVPYFWGTLGIGYRKDKIKGPITSWMDIFKPDPTLKNKIIMIKNPDDLIGMALKALGYSANSTNLKELDEVEKLLMSQKPYVKKYSYLSLTKKSVLVTGEALMSMMYSGDALMLKNFHKDIEYVLPKEGGNLWCDFLVIPNSSENKELTAKFINFLNEPKNNARLAQFVYYATPNKVAEKLLPNDFLNDPIIYPKKNSLKQSENYKSLPPRIVKKKNKIFSQVIR